MKIEVCVEEESSIAFSVSDTNSMFDADSDFIKLFNSVRNLRRNELMFDMYEAKFNGVLVTILDCSHKGTFNHNAIVIFNIKDKDHALIFKMSC